MKAVQVIQNRVAKQVTRLSWFTPKKRLLKQCNWLSVKQLVEYHTLLTAHKILQTGKPEYIKEKLSKDHQHDTRNIVGFGDNFGGKSLLSSSSFCYRAAVNYNHLPLKLRQTAKMETFKRNLKKWIMSNITET